MVNTIREYINGLKENVKLLDIVREYATDVINFYKWLEKRQNILNKDAFDKLNKLRNELKELLPDRLKHKN